MPVDLLFTNVVMPGTLKFTQMARIAVERLPHLAVMSTSNSIVHAGRLDEGMKLPNKPYTLEALARKIRQQLASAVRHRLAHAAAKVTIVPDPQVCLTTPSVLG